ncbi:pseudouridine synthase [Paenirhodobacter sp.]|uniref:pseudouridine synthase n=1 Tax=Paenirhodobacter sp. TaxID=1965326 RepID=UPI003B3C7061
MSDTPIQSGPERVAKVIARAGVASRRDAEKMILEGRVAVNGKTIATPALDVEPKDKVTIDGKPIDAPQETRLWLYYKPLGLVTTEKDDQGRRTIFDEMPAGMPRVLNVGRLDLNSEGLLLLTNDGGLKRRLEHPETAWLRKYRVRVNGRPTNETFNPLREGITIDGEDFQPMEVTLDRQQGANAWLTVGIREGKNREIRRAMAAVNLTVNRLIRVSYGPFRLNEMQPGDVMEIKRKILRDQLGDRLLTGAEDGRPARSERMERPARGPRPEGDGPRKSFGRQRDFAGDDRGAKPRSEGFRSHRDEDRPARFEKRDGDRPAFGKKPYEKREGGPRREDRDGERPAFGKKTYEKREGGPRRDGRDGERPAFGKKPYEKREGGPRRDDRDGERPAFGKKPYEKREGGPRRDDRDGERPAFGKKPYEKREGGPRRDDRDGERPAFGKKPYEKREGGPRRDGRDGERPAFGKKPYEKREGGPRREDRDGERPAFGKKPYEKREGGPRRDDRDGERPAFGKKPYEKREGGPRRDDRDGERPAFGKKPYEKREGGFKSAGFKSHGGAGKPRAAGFKSHGGAPRRPGGKPGPARG